MEIEVDQAVPHRERQGGDVIHGTSNGLLAIIRDVREIIVPEGAADAPFTEGARTWIHEPECNRTVPSRSGAVEVGAGKVTFQAPYSEPHSHFRQAIVEVRRDLALAAGIHTTGRIRNLLGTAELRLELQIVGGAGYSG